MRTMLRGFSFFETLLYMGIFSLMATALIHFSWDVIDLGAKDRTKRRVFSEARFATERINTLIRNASGIDTAASSLNNADGKLVLNTLGSSSTVIIDIVGGQMIVNESGSNIALHSGDTAPESLTFTDYGTTDDGSEYVEFTLVLASINNTAETTTSFRATTTIQSGAFIRNSGL